MIKNFFQNLDRQGVRFLLVSGQAAVLHGAAMFSEDIDLWAEPDEENRCRLLAALRQAGARYHKLTPPVTLENALLGHGFHFCVPAGSDGDVYLDIMFKPPRVGIFDECQSRGQRMETDWGLLPVIGIRDLVEIKKTQRMQDYPVITRLALREFASLRGEVTREDVAWVWRHVFELPSAEILIESLGSRTHLLLEQLSPREQAWIQARQTGEDAYELGGAVESIMLARMESLRAEDRLHWRPVLASLREWRSRAGLMEEGSLVQDTSGADSTSP